MDNPENEPDYHVFRDICELREIMLRLREKDPALLTKYWPDIVSAYSEMTKIRWVAGEEILAKVGDKP